MYPARPVQLIVPFGKDGAVDSLARLIAARLAQTWGQDVEVVNHPGDGAVTGTALAAKAPNDGYTLLLGSSSTHGTAQAWRDALPYDAQRDFTPLSLLGWTPNLVLVPPNGPDSIAELLDRARAKPGVLTYASAGEGQTIHLCAALLAVLAGTELVHKSYPMGSMLGLEALMRGEADLMCDNVLPALPYIKSGAVKALAIAGALRCNALPDLPTLDEAGLTGYSADIWIGLFAPAGVPQEIAAQIRHDLAIVLGHTDLVAELDARGFLLDVKPGAEFAAEIEENAAQWREIVSVCKPD
jgi:tripartite-type tricarboxylate transporter receptor subunit TctC